MVRRACICVLIAIAVSVTAAADATAPDVSSVLVGVSGVAGMEDSPGVAAGLEASAGYRFRPRTSWHVRAWWAPLATRMGGGSGGRVDHHVVELRTGPTWWTCSPSRCLGISTEAGLQRLWSHEMGASEDDGEPYERTESDYTAVADARFRVLLGPTYPVHIEAAVGFRFKAHLAGDIYRNRTGGGVLFSLGLAVSL